MRLGEILIARGKLDAAGVERALRLQKDGGERLGTLLVTLGLCAQRDVSEALATQLGLSLVEITAYPEFPVLEERISPRFLREARALPLKEDARELELAMADPTDSYTIGAFRMVTGRDVKPLVAIPSELDAALERLYGAGRTAVGQIVGDVEQRDELAFDADVQQLKDLASEAPVIRLVSLIITNALDARASDIHIEPFENRLAVRYRIDGVLHEVESPPRRFSAAVISRVKIMANLDIAERRLPQDGRIRLRVHGKDIDLRISTVPTMHGESVVMRILDKGGVALDFARLGFENDILERFLAVLLQPYGILLVTGPTGSGKTTTLYTALERLNQPDVKILTVEDPVEYQMPGINQIQVKPQINLTFANALRSIVRQDPDVIMIGEIRDLETAEIAVQSALTGHLVLSTVHTNDAASTMNRLLDMGVEDYLLDLDGDRSARAAPRAHAVPSLQGGACGAARDRGADAPGSIHRREGDHALPPGRLRAVRPDRLHGPDQHHGNAADHRSAAQPGDEARDRHRAAQRGDSRGDADDVRGRPAQGRPRDHDDRGSAARDTRGLTGIRAVLPPAPQARQADSVRTHADLSLQGG